MALTPQKKELLISLYKDMFSHTVGECANCLAPYSCCSDEYCQMAEENCLEWGEPIPEKQDNPKARFLGPSGCVVAPHLRPLCTLHTCQVNGLGFKPGDEIWNQKYFELREQIEDFEYERNSG